jgi:hypothetical protein
MVLKPMGEILPKEPLPKGVKLLLIGFFRNKMPAKTIRKGESKWAVHAIKPKNRKAY